MVSYRYLLRHFFTHKDYLPPAEQMPGTLFTPLHFAFSLALLLLVAGSAVYVSRHKKLIRPVFLAQWAILVIWEAVIVSWESLTGMNPGLDMQTNLSLYPCSLYLYTMPFLLWGRGVWQQMACGYLLTVGLLGGAVNFIYPATRLSEYSCLSFPGFHTFFFHGTLVFTALVLILSNCCGYRYRSRRRRELFYPCVPALLLSIPANIVNYSSVNADYMFFRGKLALLSGALPQLSEHQFTLLLYLLYILVPALFYLPSYIGSRLRERSDPPLPF